MVNHGSRQKMFITNNTHLGNNVNIIINRIQMTECDEFQKSSCREGCCRKFADVAFCDIQSNCVATPTWIVILVPILLGLAALVLVVVMLVRLRSRNVVDRYVFVRNQNSKLTKIRQRQQTQRNFTSVTP